MWRRRPRDSGDNGGGGDSPSSDNSDSGSNRTPRSGRPHGGNRGNYHKRRRNVYHRKELDKFELDLWPDASTYREFLLRLRLETHRVSGRADDKAWQWVGKAIKFCVTFEQLATSGSRFYRLDVLIAGWFIKQARDPIKTQLRLLAEKCQRGYKDDNGNPMKATMPKGRQCFWVLNEDLKKDEDSHAIYNLLHLCGVRMRDNERNIPGLEIFINRWDDIMA